MLIQYLTDYIHQYEFQMFIIGNKGVPKGEVLSAIMNPFLRQIIELIMFFKYTLKSYFLI